MRELRECRGVKRNDNVQTLNSHISLVRGTVAFSRSSDGSGRGGIVLATMMGNGCTCEVKDELGWHE